MGAFLPNVGGGVSHTMAQMRAGVETIRASIEPVGDAMTTPTDTASIARRQVHLETLETIAELVGEFVLAIVRMANDPAMDVGQAPELPRPVRESARRGAREAAQGPT